MGDTRHSLVYWQEMAPGAVANSSTQSAAVRRLAALMEQDEQEEALRLAEQRQAEWDRAAAAQKAAEEAGVDPKTKQQVKYLAGKLSAWLEVHGAAAGYDAAMGPTVEVMRHFQSYCFVHRKNYSLLGNQGMGDSFGALQVPYLLPKYSEKGPGRRDGPVSVSGASWSGERCHGVLDGW